MPGKLDGLGLARVVLDQYPNTLILLMSGFTGRELGPEAKEFDFTSKPFRLPDLLSRIGQLLNDGRSSAVHDLT